MAALAQAGRCLPFFAVAYQVQKLWRSQSQAEHAFFALLSQFKQPQQQITCINDRGFARISLVQQLRQHDLRFITRVCHNTYFASDHYSGWRRDYTIKEGGLVDLGEGPLGKAPKHQARVRLVVYRGKGDKAAWFLATDRLELTTNQVASRYARRMGIESGFRDTKGSRYGWGLKQIGLGSDVQLSVLWAAAMGAYALRMAAGASIVKKDEPAQFNWTKKGPRRGLLSVGRIAVSSGLVKREEIVNQLPKLALRLVDLKLVQDEKPAKSRPRATEAKS